MTGWAVPELWRGRTCAILATGPSLTAEDAQQVAAHFPVIAISDACKLRPQAEILYSCDAKSWNNHGGVPEF